MRNLDHVKNHKQGFNWLEYSADDLKVLRAWYFEREAGYPNLKKFEGGANWPAGDWAGVKCR